MTITTDATGATHDFVGSKAIERVTGFDTPYPHSLEWAYFPGPVRIREAISKIMKD